MSATTPVDVVVCPVCAHSGTLGPGPGGRPRASCRRCGSLERHRALVGILEGLDHVVRHGSLADIAPSPLLNSRLASMAERAEVAYLGIDFDPGADRRVVTLQASLTQMPLPEASVGLMICFHVLEHIPDDRSAMLEMRRVLAPGGVAVIQVPWRQGVPTDEDPDAPVAVRLERFGQADHVRYYGHDFDDRLEAAGLTVQRTTMGALFDPWMVELLGIGPAEPLWLATAGDTVDLDRLRVASTESAQRSLREALRQAGDERDEADGRRVKLRSQLVTARRERTQALEREAALRGRLDVRVANAGRRAVKKVLRRGRDATPAEPGADG